MRSKIPESYDISRNAILTKFQTTKKSKNSIKFQNINQEYMRSHIQTFKFKIKVQELQ